MSTALDVSPDRVCLIACQVWDTLGAVAAGWSAGLVLREGDAVSTRGRSRQAVGSDLTAVAD